MTDSDLLTWRPLSTIAELQTPVQFIRHAGPQRAQLLEQLGIRTVLDLLFHVPNSINDFSDVRPVHRLVAGVEQSVHGVVVDRDARALSGGRSLTGILLDCDGQYVRGLWFNQPWMLKKFRDQDHVVFSGKPQRRGGRWEFNSPTAHVLSVEDCPETAVGVLPRYRLTDGLRMDELRRMTRQAVQDYGHFICDALPEEFRSRHNLPHLATAIRWLHAPESADEWRRGRHRVILDDLLEFQLGLALRRRVWNRTLRAWPIEVTPQVDARIRRLFDFRFTAGQDHAVRQIAGDLSREHPMHRLLQADVGAGKTAIAAYAMLAAVAAGRQTVLMAPTEVLAVQHWETFDALLAESRVRRGFLVGGLPAAERRSLNEGIAGGTIQLIIGTQAVIQESVRFHNLALAVIDEQHRFGVRQRAAFDSGDVSPHILVMTATPIPRSLCLTQFGDLDISVIREMPPGRQQVVTSRVSAEAETLRMWEFIRRQIVDGRQAYVVCPRVEGRSEDDSAAAETTYRQLQAGVLSDVRIALLHGRMTREERHDVMDRFREHEFDVLVSTTVIEVGVDIPNATIMVIQHADRFGLSQLHQLRGRICRGRYRGFCFLLSGAESPDAVERLSAMERSADGFELAEKDAELRGPGDVLGVRQSGSLPLRVAHPVRDLEILEAARRMAEQLVSSGDFDTPEFRPLKTGVMDRFSHVLSLPQTG